MTNDNRFAPPRAEIADPAPQPFLQEMPLQVKLAVGLLWLSLALSIPMLLLSGSHEPSETFDSTFVVFMGVVYIFSAYVNMMVYRGKNWARLVILFSLALSALMLFVPSDESTAIERALEVLLFVLDAVTVYLLFREPGSLWFKNRIAAL